MCYVIVREQNSQNVRDNSDGPAVHCFAVGFLGQNLRGCRMTHNRGYREEQEDHHPSLW